MKFDDGYLIALWGRLGRRSNENYLELAKELHKIDFHWTNPSDCDREADGLGMRRGYSIEDAPERASFFEVMVALCQRLEEIVYDGIKDGRYFWFETMFKSMGLGDMINGNVDPQRVREAVNRIVIRQHEPNGKDGLFYIPGFEGDLRTKDIWYQAMEYLNYWYGQN